MANDDEEGGLREFSVLQKSQPRGIREQKFRRPHSIRAKGFHNRHQSHGPGFYRQGYVHDNEAFGSNYLGYRQVLRNGSNNCCWPASDPCDEDARRSNHAGYRQHQCNLSKNGFQRASDPHHANNCSNDMDAAPYVSHHGFSQRVRGRKSGYGLHDHQCNPQSSQFLGDMSHCYERERHHVRGQVRGGFSGTGTHGRGYRHQGASSYEGSDSFHFYGEGRRLQAGSGSMQDKNELSSCDRGRWGRRGHHFHGNYRRVGVSFGNSANFQCTDSTNVNTADSSHMDAASSICMEHKNDVKSCSIEVTPTTMKDDGSICVESETKEVCSRQASASMCTSPSPVLQQSGTQEEGTGVQKEDMTILGEQRHPNRAFISCNGGTQKRKRSSAVRDFPVRSGRLRVVSVIRKVIIKSKVRKSFVSKDLMPADSSATIGGCGPQDDLKISPRVGNETSNMINVPMDCNCVDPELTIKDCEKSYIEMNDGSSELVRSDLESDSENARKIVLYEGNLHADLIECIPENDIDPCSCSTVAEEDDGKRQLVAMSEINHVKIGMNDGSSELNRSGLEPISEDVSKIVLSEGNPHAELTQASPSNEIIISSSSISSEQNSSKEQLLAISDVNHVEIGSEAILPKENSGSQLDMEITQAELSELDVQVLDRKDTPMLEDASQISCQFPSPSMHVELPKAPDGATGAFVHTYLQENKSSLPKQRKNNRKTEKEAVNSLPKSELRHSKMDELSAALTDGLHDQGQVSKKLEVQDSSELTKETGALIVCQSTDGGNMKKKDIGKRMHFRGNVSKRLKKQDSLELTEETGALILYQSTDEGNMKAKDSGKKLHYKGHVSKKKLKAEDSFELTKDTGALVLYQSTDKGNMKTEDSGKRLIHKGSSRAKLFQTSKSLGPNDASNLSSLEGSEGLSDRTLVKRTLHEFESIRKALVKSQNTVKRADLEAAALLKEKGKWRNCNEKIVGEVPGVEVGDQFSFRMEMLIIGLHRQVQSGIDYIPGTKRSNGSPLATSIVASGGYEDDKDDGNTLIYSGQGGNNFKGNKKQECNQVLLRGNLALSNSMKEKTPVRVIRGTTDLASPSSKVYTYDGLYDVVNFSFGCGAAGFQVYQFTLTRRSGQPQVGLSFLTNLRKKGLSRPNLLLHDISRGQERLPVCVVNEVDDEPAPLYFFYIPSIKYPIWYSPLPPQGCQCHGFCDEETCSCAIKNGGEFPYNEQGYILRDKDVVYECGPLCSCSSSCQNRVTQKGLRYRLEIFKTKNRGWGVRSLDSIQPGGFICEYTGELLSDAEAEQRVENDEYLFDLGNGCNPSRIRSDLADEDNTSAIVPAPDDVAYTIDAKDLGNVARFINHSCSPNLYAQNVLYDSDDVRFPHVMLIAMENIPPMRELTYDYNYTLNTVRDAVGNVKTKACYCGAQDCQGRLY